MTETKNGNGNTKSKRTNGLPNTRTYAILQFIKDYYDRYSFSPSIRDIGKHMQMSSTSCVTYHLDFLQEMGEINRVPKISRSITLVA